MKYFLKFFVIVVFAGFLFAVCENEKNPNDLPEDKELTGTITITPDTDVITGMILTANFSGTEAVSYQWKKDGTNVGINSKTYLPQEAASYTVTVSASGYISKTSEPVIVDAAPEPNQKFMGTLSIDPGNAEIGEILTLVYNGEEIEYFIQWNFNNEPVNGKNSETYETTEAGNITVTISKDGYDDKTSSAITVWAELDFPLPAGWDTGTTTPGKTRITNAAVLSINAPVAGNYPQGAYMNYLGVSNTVLPFNQTLEWYPKINKTFDINTQYVAILTLRPSYPDTGTFRGVLQSQIAGLPTSGYKSITAQTGEDDESIKVYIVFNRTAAGNAPREMIFWDEFEGDSLDLTKWAVCIKETRPDRAEWDPNMVSVSDGKLRIKFRRDASLGNNNWIRGGAVQTRSAVTGNHNGDILFENTYGYYEAKIKYPATSGTWGAFWLMSRTYRPAAYFGTGRNGTEIDIVEFIHNQRGEYNAALHWDDYFENSRKAAMVVNGNSPGNINVYDGQFHVFGLCWSPSEYIFYVNGQEFWRIRDDQKYDITLSGNVPSNDYIGVNQNPNFIIFSIEGAEWAGNLPANFTEAEMEVDWVKVWNQPPGAN